MDKLVVLILVTLLACNNRNESKISNEQKKISESSDIIKNEVALSIDSFGIWEIKQVIDEFGEPTYERYLTTTLYGTFSNKTTQDSKLRIEFINFDFQLFEYDGRNPVKGNKSDKFIVRVQDKEGKRYTLNASLIHNNKISFEFIHKSDGKEYDSNKMHKILCSGGEIKFVVIDANSPNTIYNFVIPNADGYRKAYYSEEYLNQFKSEEYKKFLKEMEKKKDEILKKYE